MLIQPGLLSTIDLSKGATTVLLALYLYGLLRQLVIEHVCLVDLVLFRYYEVGVPLGLLIQIPQYVITRTTLALVVHRNLSLLFLAVLQQVQVYTNLHFSLFIFDMSDVQCYIS